MTAISHRSLMSGRTATKGTTRLHLFANRRTVVTLGSLFLGSLVSPLAMAQVAPLANAPISPEALAIHSRVKRPVATPVTRQVASSDSPSFNSDQGPGPGPIGPDQVAIYFQPLHRWARPCLCHTLARRLPRPTRAWWDRFSS